MDRSRAPTSDEPVVSLPKSSRLCWDNPANRELYAQTLMSHLRPLTIPNIDSITSRDEALRTVNSISTALVSAMQAASECVKTPVYSPTAQINGRKQAWWNQDCQSARDRSRLFFKIWKSLGRPHHGVAHQCYHEARKSFRRMCRRAINSKTLSMHKFLSELCRTRRSGQFWNAVRRMRSSATDTDAIHISSLHGHFKDKFSAPTTASDPAAQQAIREIYEELHNQPMKSVMISERRVARLIKHLRPKCSPGIDGISAEHLRFAVSTTLPLHLSAMLSLCLRYCCLPKDFFTGLVTPILKKSHLDPSKPQHYRPIMVSITFSKILELYMYILEECSRFSPHPSQFIYVGKRGTNTTISLANDVCSYCVARGSTINLCSLGAEGTFDCIPHHVLFSKARDAVPSHCWRILYQWYSSMTVAIKWGRS